MYFHSVRMGNKMMGHIPPQMVSSTLSIFYLRGTFIVRVSPNKKNCFYGEANADYSAECLE